jgi:uncharacterized protein YndB with AHSA1/START domain
MSSSDSVLVSEIIPATRERIYVAWLDSNLHSAFTGEAAEIEPVVGGKHSAFGGYATGQNVELQPYRRIVQTWRSSEFPNGSPDSRIEVTLEETMGGTLVTVLHTEIPTGHADRYREGWVKHYLEPMKRFFGDRQPNGINASSMAALAAIAEAENRQEDRQSDDNPAPRLRPGSGEEPDAEKPVPRRPRARGKNKAATRTRPSKPVAKRSTRKRVGARASAAARAQRKAPKKPARMTARARPAKPKKKAQKRAKKPGRSKRKTAR